MSPEHEGVIKYHLDFTPGPAPAAAGAVATLCRWHRQLRDLGLIGREPDRYDGLAYGNVSARCTGGFLVSATQTADHPMPSAEHFVRVTGWDCARNRLSAEGVNAPSSESLTHAALYDADTTIDWIFHVHCPEIWAHRRDLALPTTPEAVPYGTPAMATALQSLHTARLSGIYAMGGHRDGLVSLAASADTAGMQLLELYARVRARTGK